LQLLGEPDHDQAHVADDREQHLAQRLGLARFESALGRPVGRQAELTQLNQFASEPAGFAAEALFGGLPINELRIEQRAQHCGDHDRVVGVEAADDLGHVGCRFAQALRFRRQIERVHGGERGVHQFAGANAA